MKRATDEKGKARICGVDRMKRQAVRSEAEREGAASMDRQGRATQSGTGRDCAG